MWWAAQDPWFPSLATREERGSENMVLRKLQGRFSTAQPEICFHLWPSHQIQGARAPGQPGSHAGWTIWHDKASGSQSHPCLIFCYQSEEEEEARDDQHGWLSPNRAGGPRSTKPRRTWAACRWGRGPEMQSFAQVVRMCTWRAGGVQRACLPWQPGLTSVTALPGLLFTCVPASRLGAGETGHRRSLRVPALGLDQPKPEPGSAPSWLYSLGGQVA